MNQSFGLLKPDCLERGIQEDIFKMIRSFDLKIIKMKKVQLNEKNVDAIWSSCRNEYFYKDMVRFLTSGKCIVFLVEGEDAINRLNVLVGHYDPLKAGKGTIRGPFGCSAMENVIHSSLNEEAFQREANLFFSL